MLSPVTMDAIEVLRRRWPWVIAVTVAAAVAITVFESSYNALQTAPTAAAFRRTLTDHGRAIGATCCDIVFACGYAILGLIAVRVLNLAPRLARPARALVVASAAFDELENLTLIRNIVGEATLTDGWITVMRVPGTLKWIGSPVFLVLLIGVVRRAIGRTDRRPSDR